MSNAYHTNGQAMEVPTPTYTDDELAGMTREELREALEKSERLRVRNSQEYFRSLHRYEAATEEQIDEIRSELNQAKSELHQSRNGGLHSQQDDLPALPRLAYDRLPGILKELCDLIDNWYERDAFLSGALGACSALMPKVRFRYNRKYYSPHLFIFILAEAGRGKGIITHALKLANKVDELLVDEHQDAYREWQERSRAYEQAKRSRKSSPLDPDPPGPEPAETLLRAAEDTNLPVLYRTLEANPEGILIGATEADIISQANRRGDIGGFSALMRQAFEHERAQKATKSEGTIRAPEPRFALVLSGTRDQFKPLVESVENGLFSRFAVYRFAAPLEYRSQRPKPGDIKFIKAVENARDRLCDLYEALRKRKESLYVDTPAEKWDRIDGEFKALFNKTLKDAGAPAELAATVYRGAVICFRIAAILCVLRRFEEGKDLTEAASLEVGDDDVAAAISLSLVYVEQSMRQALDMLGSSDERVIEALSYTGGADRMTGQQLSFLQMLPNEFERKDAIDIGKGLGIAERTADRWLQAWDEEPTGPLNKLRQGYYRKKAVWDRGKSGKGGNMQVPESETVISGETESGKSGKGGENGEAGENGTFATSATSATSNGERNSPNQSDSGVIATFATFATGEGGSHVQKGVEAPF